MTSKQWPEDERRKGFTRKQRASIFLAADGVCHICKAKIIGFEWDVEHIIPLASGGTNDPSNLAPAHKSCHSDKTSSDVKTIAKIKQVRDKHIGAWVKKSPPMPGSRKSKFKKKMDGSVVIR